MIISLIGFMGCGKSSVGRRLSQLLCCRFIDLDETVEEVAGKRIPEIFASEGEAAFRRFETEVLTNILSAETERQCAPCEVGRVDEIPMPPVCASRIHPLAGGGMSSPSHLPPTSEVDLIFEKSLVSASESSSEGETVVLALGGGTVMTPECAELVRQNSRCIYLRATIDTIVERLSNETSTRPLLTSSQEVERRGVLRARIESLMSARTSTYENTVNIIIDTDGKSIEQICSEILG